MAKRPFPNHAADGPVSDRDFRSVRAFAGAKANLPPDLQALIAESLKANPEIKQKSQLKAAAQETIRPAGALDNPQAGFSLLNLPTDTWSFAQEPMTQKAFSLSQKIPFPGQAPPPVRGGRRAGPLRRPGLPG